MFSLLQKFGINNVNNNNAKVQFEAPSMPVVRTPQREIAPAIPQAAETESFGCLNDVFGELLNEEVSYALSKW